MTYDNYEEWQDAVRVAHKDVAGKLMFKNRPDHTISAELPNQDRCYGVWDDKKDEGVVLAKLNAKARLRASTENPISDGVAFDTLIDGKPEDTTPLVQELTDDDGGIDEEDDDQNLLMNDIPV